MNIKGAKILVTGGSLGIGKETARQLVEKGANVVITGRNKKTLEAAATATGAKAVVFDISDLDSIKDKAAECITALGGKIDVLLNNAGIGDFPILGEITPENFNKVFNTNVFGLALLTAYLVMAMKAAQAGTIINIGSTAAQKGFGRGTVYSASKFAVRSMTQCWQAELRKDNIRVCLVNPSEVTTAFNVDSREEKAEEANKLSSSEIGHTICSVIEMDDRGFIPEVTVWATNPF